MGKWPRRHAGIRVLNDFRSYVAYAVVPLVLHRAIAPVEIINRLKQQSLDIVDVALETEFALFKLFGETDQTISFLEIDYRPSISE
jgi:hypothetical protein